MGFYESVGFILFLFGAFVHLRFVKPALKGKDTKSYYIGELPLFFRGLYYFFELSAYRKKCIEENKSLFISWLSIAIMIMFIFWLLAGLIILLCRVLSGEIP